MTVQKDINKKGGFLGLGNNKTRIVEEYTILGTEHIGGGSNQNKISAAQAECIKAQGGESKQEELSAVVWVLLLLLLLPMSPLLVGFLLVLRR